MRRLAYSVGLVVLSLASTVVLASVQTMTALVALTATALIMGGTGHPLSTPQDSAEFVNGYTADANTDYIVLTGFCGEGACTPTAVSTPEQFMPVSGAMPFDQSVGQGVVNLNQAINAQPAGESLVVFGYSQSARIASIQKGNLAAAGSTLPVSFVLIGNPNRPNGGILERFEGLQIPLAGITFDGATPTDTTFKTVDVTRQYDGWSDFPNNPLNPFATANAIAGIQYLHSDYQSVGLGDALYQGSYGDTDYYMIPSQRLPLLMPLDQAGVPSPLVTMLDAPTRVLVEAGYDRTVSPGAPTQASILYFPNPVQTGMNFIIAIPTGVDDGAQEAANIRPFGTPPIDQRSPYGVGGPPVNAGAFDSTGAPLTSAAPAAAAPGPQAASAPAQGPLLPNAQRPAAGPTPLQPLAPNAPSMPATAPAIDKPVPATPVGASTPGWWEPAALTPPVADVAAPTPADVPKPVDMPKPTPLDLPKPPVDLPKPPADLPKPPVDLPKPAPVDLRKPPVDLPRADLPRTDILPKVVPPKIDPPAQAPIVGLPPADIPAPAFGPPELPAAPVAPPVQAPVLPELPALPAAPPPQLPALPSPPPMPALPPPPPLPNIAGILGGIRLPF